MREIEDNDVSIGKYYFVVCDDGVVRYLVAELQENLSFVEYVFYDVHGEEQYRTYSPFLVLENV